VAWVRALAASSKLQKDNLLLFIITNLRCCSTMPALQLNFTTQQLDAIRQQGLLDSRNGYTYGDEEEWDNSAETMVIGNRVVAGLNQLKEDLVVEPVNLSILDNMLGYTPRPGTNLSNFQALPFGTQFPEGPIEEAIVKRFCGTKMRHFVTRCIENNDTFDDSPRVAYPIRNLVSKLQQHILADRDKPEDDLHEGEILTESMIKNWMISDDSEIVVCYLYLIKVVQVALISCPDT